MSQSHEVSALVPLSPGEAFALAHTLGADRRDWDSQVIARMLLRDATEAGLGTQVFERRSDGLRTIIEYDLWVPGRLSSAHLVKGPWWLDRYGEGWHFVESEGGTRVTWKVTFASRFPVLAPAAERLVLERMRRQLTARMNDYRAAALDTDLVARAASGILPRDARHRDRHRAT